MKDRAATKWHVQVLPAAKKQWYIRLVRSGRVVLVGETRKGKASTLRTAALLAGELGVFEDLTDNEPPNSMWEF